MERSSELKRRTAVLAFLAFALVVLVNFTLYLWVDQRRLAAELVRRQAQARRLAEQTGVLERELAQQRAAAEANQKLRAALQGRLAEAPAELLLPEEAAVWDRVRSLLVEAPSVAQNEALRGALREVLEAAELRELREASAPVEREVERERGLRFLRPVRYRRMQVAEFPDYLRQELRAEFSEEELRDFGRALAFLGLLPEGSDLEQLYMNVMSEQVGAFYDEKKGHLVTFRDRPGSSGVDRMILAHELTHALDDQHFPLRDLGLGFKKNEDRARAALSLIEGTATMVMGQVYLQQARRAGLGGTVKDILAMFRQTTEQFNRAPPYIQQSLLFPYLQGQQFVLELLSRGGMEAINEAYRNPPVSTEQVLHPEKYFAREEPREEQTEDIVGQVRQLCRQNGWNLLANNVVGEFGLRLLLAGLEGVDAHQAAAGWDGDRYAVFEVVPQQLAMVWVTCWDTARDAEEFEQALIALAQKTGRRMTMRRNSLLRTVTVVSTPNDEILNIIQEAIR